MPKFIQVYSLILGLSSFSALGQDYSLHPDLAGYKDCGQLENPLSCLENTLKSIDSDQGYYSQFSENRRKQFKAEYCMQLAYTYRQVDRSDLVRKNLELAAGYLKGMDLSTLNEDFKSYLGVKELLVDFVNDEYRDESSSPDNGSEDFQRIVDLMKDFTDLSEVSVSAAKTEEVEQPQVPEIVHEKPEERKAEFSNQFAREEKVKEYDNKLLEYLRAYLNKNPLSEEFIKTHASDSCVIQIHRLASGSGSSLDTYVSYTNHMEQIGMHLMGISKEIKYNGDLPEFDVKMTILVRPSNYSSVSMRHGKFYVYYAI